MMFFNVLKAFNVLQGWRIAWIKALGDERLKDMG